MKRLDIVLIPYPFSDDFSASKVRPALVVGGQQNSRGEVILVGIYSKNPNREKQFDVILEPSSKNNLQVSSILKVRKLIAVDRKSVLGKMGELESKYYDG